MNTTTAPTTYCNECHGVQTYKVNREDGEWSCTACGFAIECVECGRSMHHGHDCERELQGLS